MARNDIRVWVGASNIPVGAMSVPETEIRGYIRNNLLGFGTDPKPADYLGR